MRYRRPVCSSIAVLTAVIAVGLLAAAPTASAQSAGQTLAWDDEGTQSARFGPNDAITIAQGTILFACDSFFPTADVYVVEGIPLDGDSLSDVSGEPNTVFGATGGFFSDTIGYAAPSGGLGAGTYSVVYDECQDGMLDPFDAVFPDAFEVAIPADPAAIPPIDPAIAALKADALERAKTWKQHLGGLEFIEMLAKYAPLLDCAEGLFALTVTKCLEGLLRYAFGKVFGNGTGGDLAIAKGKDAINDNIKHWKAIGADPPDPDITLAARLTAVETLTSDVDDDLIDAQLGVYDAGASEAAVAGALLQAIERYQGADVANDPNWALAHASEIERFANLLASHLASESDSLNTLAATLESDTRDWDGLAAAIAPELARIAETGFSSGEEAAMRNVGLSHLEIAQRGALAAQDADVAGFTEGGLQASIDDLIAVNDTSAQVLRNLAESAAAITADIETEPALVRRAPSADAGGPYATGEGSPLTLAGAASDPDGSIALVAWDLDRDGQFDDATGLAPSVKFPAAFGGYIGLRVTDNDGNVAVDYTRITVDDTDPAPDINAYAPTGVGPEVVIGSTQQFSVSGSDPHGQTISIAWTLDGAGAGSGNTFDFTPSEADLGLHTIVATLSDGANVVRMRWTSAVVLPDADEDGWADNIDCENGDPAVHPGATEVVGNGVDDDCQPATPDDGSAGGATGLKLLETIPIPIGTGTSVTSSTTLLNGITYRLRASGTFTIGCGDIAGADAEYAVCPGFGPVGIDHCLRNPADTDLGIAINDPDQFRAVRKQPFWGAFQADHVYHTDFVGLGAPITLNYHDCAPGDNRPGGAQPLQVEIFIPVEPPTNAPPVVQAGADTSAAPEEPVTLAQATFEDAGDPRPHAASIDWGDASAGEFAEITESAGSGSVAASHAYSAPGTYTVTVTVTDTDGASGTDTFKVVVDFGNQRPRLAAIADQSMPEGSDLVMPLLAIDPEGDPVTLQSSGLPGYGDLTDRGAGGGALRFSPVDDDAATIEVRACDTGGCAKDTFALTVKNVAPTAAAANDGPVVVDSPASVRGAGADPGADTLEFAFDCDRDGEFGAFDTTSSTQCVFSSSGSHDVGVRVRDDDGGLDDTHTSVTVNAPPGHANVVKSVCAAGSLLPCSGVPPSGTEAFAFQLRVAASPTQAGAILETKTADALNAGWISFAADLAVNTTYQLCELVLPGWMTTLGPPFFTAYNPSGDNSVICTDFTVGYGETKAFNIQNVKPPGGMGRTIGFWKNWAACSKGGQKPILDQTLALSEPAGIEIGDLILHGSTATPEEAPNCTEAERILNKSAINSGKKLARDPAFNLAAQLLAAKLNSVAGTGTCSAAVNTTNDAQALLDAVEFNGISHLTLTTTQTTQANTLATTLDGYNNNSLC